MRLDQPATSKRTNFETLVALASRNAFTFCFESCTDGCSRSAEETAATNRTAAARLLGVTFRSMRYRLERLGIE